MRPIRAPTAHQPSPSRTPADAARLRRRPLPVDRRAAGLVALALAAAFALVRAAPVPVAAQEVPPAGDAAAPAAPAPPLALLVLTEPAGAAEVIEAAGPAIRIGGQARPNAVVSIEGDLVDLAEDGTFAVDVPLVGGLHALEVLASDPDTEEQAAVTLLVVAGP